ncbi:MAG: rod shape-determining protein [Cyclobacteriaceae bacterium]|nr:rod shape-determining protein [Cyclobacteriaceae bacterium]UYN85441.1 MAG: rod shape-determining protein [Cyclobacteriaceae bacterium]
MFSVFKHKSFSIDLGNNNTLLASTDKMLLAQPSYIVFNANHSVKAVGEKAFEMFEKTHEELTPVKPLKGGVIADFDSASTMLREMVNRAYAKRSFLSGFDHIISGVPYYTTEVERRALRDALDQFNPRKRSLLFEPLAAAIGMGLNIQEPDGKLVIDIGGGITEIVIISLSGVAAFQSLKVAGDTFDVAIQDYFRRSYNMAIGLKTAEYIKIAVGAVWEPLEMTPETLAVKGKDMVTGIPVVRKINHREVAFILEKSISAIERGIIQTLETCPPELAADIYQNGMHLTGGGALLRGIKDRFEHTIKLPVHVDKHALSSVSKGIAGVLANPKKYAAVLID